MPHRSGVLHVRISSDDPKWAASVREALHASVPGMEITEAAGGSDAVIHDARTPTSASAAAADVANASGTPAIAVVSSRTADSSRTLRRAGFSAVVHESMLSELHPAVAAAAGEAQQGEPFDAVPSPLWVYDTQTLAFVRVNEAAIRLYGYSREEFLRMTLRDIQHSDDFAELERVVAELHVTGAGHHAISHHKTRDGRGLDVEIVSAAFPLGSLTTRLVSARDVTDRVAAERDRERAEEALSRAHSLLQFHIENSPLAVIEWDAEFRVLRWSAMAEHVFGWRASEVMGTSFTNWRFVHEDDADFVVKGVQEMYRAGVSSSNITNRNYRKDGSVLVCEWYNSAFRNPDGTLASVLSLAHDVTRRVEAERALAASEQRYRGLAEALQEIIWINHVGGEVEYCNRYWYEFTGAKPEEMAGGGGLRYVHPEDVDRLREGFARAQESGTPYDFRYRVKRRSDGMYRWFQGTMLRTDAWPDGQRRWVGAARDIHEDLLSEQRIRESEERFRTLADSAPLMIWTTDHEGRLTYANRGWTEFRNLIAPNAPLEEWLSIANEAERERVTELVRGAIADRKSFEAEFELRRADGEFRRVLLRGDPRFAGPTEFLGLAGTCVDIHDRTLVEARLRHAQKLEAVGRLASGIAHDFNNLMTAIFGYLAMARSTLDAGHPAVRALSHLEEAATQASGVTKDLLTFARKDVPVRKSVRLADAIEQGYRLVRHALPATVRLNVDMANAADLCLMADPMQLQQVVMNLAINASDAMPSGGELSIVLRADRSVPDAVRAILTVHDTGEGIDAADLPRIFEPFFTTKPPGRGSGLGLSIVDSIVREYGGTTAARSARGEGTTFEIVLPVVSIPDERASPVARRTSQLVLLADRNRHVREVLATSLRADGFSVAQADSAESLSRQASELHSSIAAIIVDESLAFQTQIGQETCRTFASTVPVIVLMSRGADEHRLSEGLVAVYKPVHVSQVVTLVDRLIQGATLSE
jgi:two-component system cell cycle sensor histidine kinase/response regulator CckA